MMAIVSELSMNQASAMKLQASVKEQEAELEQVSKVQIATDYFGIESHDTPAKHPVTKKMSFLWRG